MDNFICQHIGCEQSFKGRQQRWNHEQSCTFPPKDIQYVVQDGKILCKKCNKGYSNHPNFSRHLKECGIKKARKNKKTVHQCEICPAEFDRKSKLDRHKSIHERSSVQANKVLDNVNNTSKYICEYCSKEYTLEVWYSRHKETSHNDDMVASFVTDDLNIPSTSTNLSLSEDNENHSSTNDRNATLDEAISSTECQSSYTLEDEANSLCSSNSPATLLENENEISACHSNISTASLEFDASGNTSTPDNVETPMHRSTTWRHMQRKRKASIIDSICEELTRTKSEAENHKRIGQHVIQYLQVLRNSSYRANHKIAKYLFQIFGEDLLNDDDMLYFLSKELKFTRTSRFKLML